MSIKILDLGLTDYIECWEKQKKIVAKKIVCPDKEDFLLFTEHRPVVTFGRSGKQENIKDLNGLATLGIEIVKVDRGGDITFHEPGQLIIYPIFNLKKLEIKIISFIRIMESAVCSALQRIGLKKQLLKKSAGIWYDNKKILSLGFAFKKAISFHGMALNINNSLKLLDYIYPCGDKSLNMTTLFKILNNSKNLAKIKNILVEEIKGRISYICV